MSTPAKLRERSRLVIRAAREEPALELKRSMARHAFALAQRAQEMEREEAAREGLRFQAAPLSPLSRYRSLVVRAISARSSAISVTFVAIAGDDDADR